VNSGAFSRDGHWVATASFDGTARVWDAATGEPITPPLPHGLNQRGEYNLPYSGSDLPRVAFTPDDSQLIVVSRNVIQTRTLKPDPRPVDELILLAQVLSGSKIDRTGTQVPMDTDALKTAWDRVGNKK
jgi:WD40 repeat protein